MRDSTVALWIGFGIVALTLIVALFLWSRYQKTGRIEGQLLINGKPAPRGVQIACEVTETSEMSSDGHFSVSIMHMYAETDADGRFAFHYIRAGEVTLGVIRGDSAFTRYAGGLVTIEHDSDWTNDYERMAFVEAGKTTQVTLGEGVVAVRARLLPPQGVVLDSVDGLFWREPDVEPAERSGTNSEALQVTPEGKIWREQVQQRFYATVSENGMFESHAVAPGRYRVKVFYPTPGGADSQTFTSDPIEIGAPDDGEVTPIDLGEIALRPQ